MNMAIIRIAIAPKDRTEHLNHSSCRLYYWWLSTCSCMQTRRADVHVWTRVLRLRPHAFPWNSSRIDDVALSMAHEAVPLPPLNIEGKGEWRGPQLWLHWISSLFCEASINWDLFHQLTVGKILLNEYFNFNCAFHRSNLANDTTLFKFR